MSRRYSSWRSLISPNIRSSSTSEKPITALSGVRSSWDMLARNSDLWRLAISSSSVLVCSSRNRRALTMASADWPANVSSSSTCRGRRSPCSGAGSPGRRRSCRRAASEPRAPSASRRGTRYPDAGRAPCLPGRAPRASVWSVAARPTSVDSRSIVMARSCFSSSGLLPSGGADVKRIGGLVVLHDRSAVGSGEPHGVADDLVQDLVEVEARADRVADLPQRLQLRDLAASSRPWPRARASATLPHHDRALDGELLEELALAGVEGRDLGAPHRQHADDLVLQDHRRRQQGAIAGQLLEVRAPVVRVVEHVGNLNGAPFVGRAPDGRRSGSWPADGAQQVPAELVGDLAGDRGTAGTRRPLGCTGWRLAHGRGARRARERCRGCLRGPYLRGRAPPGSRGSPLTARGRPATRGVALATPVIRGPCARFVRPLAPPPDPSKSAVYPAT